MPLCESKTQRVCVCVFGFVFGQSSGNKEAHSLFIRSFRCQQCIRRQLNQTVTWLGMPVITRQSLYESFFHCLVWGWTGCLSGKDNFCSAKFLFKQMTGNTRRRSQIWHLGAETTSGSYHRSYHLHRGVEMIWSDTLKTKISVFLNAFAYNLLT